MLSSVINLEKVLMWTHFQKFLSYGMAFPSVWPDAVFLFRGRRRTTITRKVLVDSKIFRQHESFFVGAKISENLDRDVAIDFVNKLSKAELSSRFSGRFREGMFCLEHKECPT